MVLATQLKMLIKKNGVTVTSLGKKTGIPVKTLYSWLQGQSPRSLDQLKLVADLFGVSIDFILFNHNAIKSSSFEDFKDEINAGTYEVILRKIKTKE